MAAAAQARTGARRRTAVVAPPPGKEAGSANEVRLVGRVSAAAQQRELPSGDVLASWRLVVDRPPPRRPAPDGVRVPTVDTVTCVAWTPGLRRTAASLEPGDVVEVVGALRQRYWKAGHGLASRTEVEAAAVRRLSRGS